MKLLIDSSYWFFRYGTRHCSVGAQNWQGSFSGTEFVPAQLQILFMEIMIIKKNSTFSYITKYKVSSTCAIWLGLTLVSDPNSVTSK